MMRVAALIVAGGLFVMPQATAPGQLATGADLVEVDAVVVDGKGRPITGLLQGDFTIRDDGKAVDIVTFAEVTGPLRDDPDTARTLVLLLDDTGVSPIGTQTIQTIARAFVSSAADIDDVSVVRLHARAD